MAKTCSRRTAGALLQAASCPSVLIGTLVFAAGCATGYQPNSLTGGFEESQLNANSFRVSFRGNGYTTPNRAEELTLLRSAEICLEHGFPGFVLLRERTDVKNDSIWLSNSTYHRGNYFSSGTNLTFSSPSTSNLVSCINEKPANAFAYEARVLYESLTAKYAVPRSPKLVDWQANLSQIRSAPDLEVAAQPVRASLVGAQPPEMSNTSQLSEWLTRASDYARRSGCSAEPMRSAITSQGAERYEFSCAPRPALHVECRDIGGGCRRAN